MPDWLPIDPRYPRDVLPDPKKPKELQQRSAFVLGSEHLGSPGDASDRDLRYLRHRKEDLWQIDNRKLLRMFPKLLTQFPTGIAQTACDPGRFAFARHFRKWWKLTPKLCSSPIQRK